MDIVIVASASAWGGAEVHTAELARVLDSRGHHVSIMELGSNLYGRGRFEQRRRIRVISLPNAKPPERLGLLESLRVVRSVRGDICVFPRPWHSGLNLGLELALRILFRTFVVIEHSVSDPFPSKSSRRHFRGTIPGIGIGWYKARLLRLIRSYLPDRVVCVSNAVANGLIKSERYPVQKIAVIHTGIDPDVFRSRPELRVATRRLWAIPENAFVFGSIGRLEPIKGLDLAIEAFRMLLLSQPHRDIRLVLMGRGSMYDEIKRSIEVAGIAERVIVRDFTASPWEAYPVFDVFIMPSRNEALGLALMEAMACGCVPIAMGVGGIPEVITHQGLGWLVQPNDKLGFLRAMRDAVNCDAESLEEMRGKARETIVSKFSAGVRYPIIAELLERETLTRRNQSR